MLVALSGGHGSLVDVPTLPYPAQTCTCRWRSSPVPASPAISLGYPRDIPAIGPPPYPRAEFRNSAPNPYSPPPLSSLSLISSLKGRFEDSGGRGVKWPMAGIWEGYGRDMGGQTGWSDPIGADCCHVGHNQGAITNERGMRMREALAGLDATSETLCIDGVSAETELDRLTNMFRRVPMSFPRFMDFMRVLGVDWDTARVYYAYVYRR